MRSGSTTGVAARCSQRVGRAAPAAHHINHLHVISLRRPSASAPAACCTGPLRRLCGCAPLPQSTPPRPPIRLPRCLPRASCPAAQATQAAAPPHPTSAAQASALSAGGVGGGRRSKPRPVTRSRRQSRDSDSELMHLDQQVWWATSRAVRVGAWECACPDGGGRGRGPSIGLGVRWGEVFWGGGMVDGGRAMPCTFPWGRRAAKC